MKRAASSPVKEIRPPFPLISTAIVWER
jgi:hypothetical protein